MKTPGFWFRPPGLAALLLAPFGILYYGLSRLRRGRPLKKSAPLIVVGNVVAGGAGKTPTVLALTALLQARGLKVHLIAKGYGGCQKGPLQVNDTHSAADVGDEPLLLRRAAPTFIGSNRAATYQMAAVGADVVISDDGLQNPNLQADLALLVIDGVLGFGNGHLIPAGPLREPVARALSRVQGIIQIGGADRPIGRFKPLLADFTPVQTEWLANTKVVAFAGIGQPEKFFATLTACGARIVTRHAFADHQPYNSADIQPLLDEAARLHAVVVTTSKDHVRIPASLRSEVRVIDGHLHWRTRRQVDELLDGFLAACRKTPS